MMTLYEIYYFIGAVKMAVVLLIYIIINLCAFYLVLIFENSKKIKYLTETKQLDNYALWEDIKRKESKLRFLKFMRYDK